MTLAHRNVLEEAPHRSATGRRACGHVRGTDRGVDLAVVRGHAVPVVQVGEGFGGAPGLQVARHPDRRPHLPAVQRRA